MEHTLELTLAEGGCIARNDDELCLARAEGFESRLVAKCNCVLLTVGYRIHARFSAGLLPSPKGTIPFPDFMTRARRELMLSAVFLAFFVGAIAALEESLKVPLCVKRSGLFKLLSFPGRYFVWVEGRKSWRASLYLA